MLAWFFRGSGPVLLKKTLYFCDFFQGGGPDSLLPVSRLDPRMFNEVYMKRYIHRGRKGEVNITFECS